MDFRILPPEELIEEGMVSLPPSKSLLNRRFMFSALCPGASIPEAGENEAGDIVVMRSAVAAVMAAGESGQPMEVNVGESATALRFLTALAASHPGSNVILTGEPGLLRRPMGPLVEALRECGADIEYVANEGFAPLHIRGRELAGGDVELDATVSSQFISALLMVAPLMKEGLAIRFDGEPSSLPYIKMTAAMMAARGVQVELAPTVAVVEPGGYPAGGVENPAEAEADWSAAAFWYEVTALTAGWISLGGLLPPGKSLQGDSRCAEFFECLGVLTAESEDNTGMLELSPSPEVYGRLDLDLADYPDLAPALVVTCCLLGVPFKFDGLRALSVKESDRLSALAEEMDKIGCNVEKIRDYGLEWEGKRHPIGSMPEFDPRGDHRLAMALAPVSVYVPGIVVKDAGCVAKSYPGFWDDLRSLGFRTYDPTEPIEDIFGVE